MFYSSSFCSFIKSLVSNFPFKNSDERRSFTEAPMPGYKGYVPRHEEHKLGSRYGVWTRHAYGDSLMTMLTEERNRTEKLNPLDFKPAEKL